MQNYTVDLAILPSATLVMRGCRTEDRAVMQDSATQMTPCIFPDPDIFASDKKVGVVIISRGCIIPVRIRRHRGWRWHHGPVPRREIAVISKANMAGSGSMGFVMPTLDHTKNCLARSAIKGAQIFATRKIGHFSCGIGIR